MTLSQSKVSFPHAVPRFQQSGACRERVPVSALLRVEIVPLTLFASGVLTRGLTIQHSASASCRTAALSFPYKYSDLAVIPLPYLSTLFPAALHVTRVNHNVLDSNMPIQKPENSNSRIRKRSRSGCHVTSVKRTSMADAATTQAL